MESIPFSEEQVKAQIAKISATPEFSRSENKKRLLDAIVEWRLAGVEDLHAYSGDCLTADVFKKKGDTTLGKVEGRALRIALSEYYRTSGLNDPILIFIPAGTFRPEILPNISRSPMPHYTMNLHWIATHHGSGYREPDGFPKAQHLVSEAIRDNPNHFGLLSTKALLHVMHAMYGGQPLPALMAARSLLEPKCSSYSIKDLPWEAVLANACVRALLDWDWSGVSAAINGALPPTLLSSDVDKNRLFLCEGFRHYWYAGFLASQGEVHRAIEIILKYLELLGNPPLDVEWPHHTLDLVRSDLAFLQICSGDFSAAEKAVKDALVGHTRGLYGYPLGIVNAAILAEARGKPDEALRYMESISENIDTNVQGVFGCHPLERKKSIHWLIVAALRALFSGLSGDTESAKTDYRTLLGARKSTAAVPDAYFPPSTLGIAALGTGDEELALQWLTEAVNGRDPFVLWLNTIPYFRHLHGNDEFRSLVVDTMGLKLGF